MSEQNMYGFTPDEFPNLQLAVHGFDCSRVLASIVEKNSDYAPSTKMELVLAMTKVMATRDYINAVAALSEETGTRLQGAMQGDRDMQIQYAAMALGGNGPQKAVSFGDGYVDARVVDAVSAIHTTAVLRVLKELGLIIDPKKVTGWGEPTPFMIVTKVGDTFEYELTPLGAGAKYCLMQNGISADALCDREMSELRTRIFQELARVNSERGQTASKRPRLINRVLDGLAKRLG